jgi:hypothetical protein
MLPNAIACSQALATVKTLGQFTKGVNFAVVKTLRMKKQHAPHCRRVSTEWRMRNNTSDGIGPPA